MMWQKAWLSWRVGFDVRRLFVGERRSATTIPCDRYGSSRSFLLSMRMLSLWRASVSSVLGGSKRWFRRDWISD